MHKRKHAFLWLLCLFAAVVLALTLTEPIFILRHLRLRGGCARRGLERECRIINQQRNA